MDLIYTNPSRVDQGVLEAYGFDLSYGAEENDFEVTLGANEPMIEPGSVVYIEGTEYGGQIDGIKAKTDGETVTYKGRTWHGILNSKVIEPLKEDDIAGQNLFVANENIVCGNLGVSGVYDETDHTYTLNGTYALNGNITFSAPTTLNLVAGKKYTLAWRYVSGKASIVSTGYGALAIFDASLSKFRRSAFGNGEVHKDYAFTFSTEDFAEGVANYQIMIQMWAVGSTFDNYKINIQLVEGEYTAATLPKYAPYGQSDAVTITQKDASDVSFVGKYLILSGDANDCVRYIVKRHGLSELFAVPEEKSGVNISEYKFHRYCKGYDGLRDMLGGNGTKLKIEWKDRSVLLYAEPIADYTGSPIDGDIASLTVEQHKNKVNHLICLGKGELDAREIIHLYVDQSGNIGDTQFYTGMEEYTDIYENTNAESSEDLRSGGVSRLKELRNNDKAEIALAEMQGLSYDIGDIVGASEIRSGVKVAAAVTQKIVKINNGVVSADYKTGG